MICLTPSFSALTLFSRELLTPNRTVVEGGWWRPSVTHPHSLSTHISKETSRQRHLQASPYARRRPDVQGDGPSRDSSAPRRREKQRLNLSASFPLGSGNCKVCCLQGSPVGCCLSCPPRNLLINGPLLALFPSLSHHPTPLQSALGSPLQ